MAAAAPALSADQFQSLLDADPQFQSLVAAAQKAGGSKDKTAVEAMKSYVQTFAKSKGFQIPAGVDVSAATGKIVPDADWDWGRFALALTPIAAGLAVAAIAGAGAVGGASGGAAAAGGSSALPGIASPFAAAIPATEGVASATALGLPVTAGLGTAGSVATAAGGGSTLAKVVSGLSDVGKGVGAATDAAGQNDLNQEQLGLSTANTDIAGQKASTDEMLAVDKANTQKGQQHLRDQVMLEKASHPSVSPFDVTGGPKVSPEYLSALQQIAAKNPDLLKTPDPYKPIGASGLQAATNTQPSTLQKVGNIASPVLTTLPKIAKLFR